MKFPVTISWKRSTLGLLVVAGLTTLAAGWITDCEELFGAVFVGIVLLAYWRSTVKPTWSAPVEAASSVVELPALPAEEPADDEESLVRQMLRQDRYALLLRSQIAGTLDAAQLRVALARFEAKMALVQAGQVVLGNVDELLAEGKLDLTAIAARKARLVEVQPAYLDKFAVTNEQFQEFVRAGGYLDIEIWDEEVWPAVADFIDMTGCPGPRYWKHGRFIPGNEEHPVVGVCWYEAAAYARWVGKRLPSDAEWVKAACAPVALKTGTWLQRKYPWGDSFSNERANLFAAKSGGTVPVDQFSKGSTSGGHCQLIGNVWEWTASNFGSSDDPTLTVATPMKSIRGGAYDTYFETQATCHFQSGESPLGRKHNIGFRLALSARELAPAAAPRTAPAEHTDTPRVLVGANA